MNPDLYLAIPHIQPVTVEGITHDPGSLKWTTKALTDDAEQQLRVHIYGIRHAVKVWDGDGYNPDWENADILAALAAIIDNGELESRLIQ